MVIKRKRFRRNPPRPLTAENKKISFGFSKIVRRRSRWTNSKTYSRSMFSKFVIFCSKCHALKSTQVNKMALPHISRNESQFDNFLPEGRWMLRINQWVDAIIWKSAMKGNLGTVSWRCGTSNEPILHSFITTDFSSPWSANVPISCQKLSCILSFCAMSVHHLFSFWAGRLCHKLWKQVFKVISCVIWVSMEPMMTSKNMVECTHAVVLQSFYFRYCYCIGISHSTRNRWPVK